MKANAKIGFISAVVFLILFVLLIVLVRSADVSAIGPCGTKIGLSSLNGSVRDGVGRNDTMYSLTKWIGYFSLSVAAAFAALGVIQLIKRKSLAKVDREILALGGLYAALAAVYILFEFVIVNYRPILEEGQSFPEASFPSSHTILVLVIFGSAAYMAGRYVKNRGLRIALILFCILIAAFTAVARLLSGVHWFTDILGGVYISLALLSAFSGVLDLIAGSGEKNTED